jgi:pyruvate/2-oxoglutarate dehydrogenase complex dihydrolipoamide dehydrogenase (E3) component
MIDVLVVGAGPAGVLAALHAAELGARTTLVTSEEFGGMSANDGPVPVRTLAHAARLIDGARQLDAYGVTVGEPVLDYPKLLRRVRDAVRDVRACSYLRPQIEALGVNVREHAGKARFVDPHTIETERGLRLGADAVIVCTGGTSRPLPIPGFEHTSTHCAAWALSSVPPSMIVVGGGATGLQVASVFHAFGTKVELFEAAPRIAMSEDADVSAALAAAFRASGIPVHEQFGTIESFEKTPTGVRMTFSKGGLRRSVDAALAIVAVGWMADTQGLNLAAAGVEANARGFVAVDRYLKTSAPHIFAAGDITGRLMLAPQAMQQGYVAATNAVRGPTLPLWDEVAPSGGFTNPQYAHVGLTEAKAREDHDVAIAVQPFDASTRTIIDGRTLGFCKLIADRATHRMLGCHVVGEQAIEIVQVAAIAMAAEMRVEDFARVPLSFPTYAMILGHAATTLALDLRESLPMQSHQPAAHL